ncbi:TPA: hypothetical protein ACG3KH_004138 [Clostridioides difficile]
MRNNATGIEIKCTEKVCEALGKTWFFVCKERTDSPNRGITGATFNGPW